MKFTLRNLIGVILIICLILGVFNRPIREVLPSINWYEQVSCLLVPFWCDFYLLGIEKYWPFAEIFNKPGPPKPEAMSILMLTLGMLLFAASHMAAAIFTIFKICQTFFGLKI